MTSSPPARGGVRSCRGAQPRCQRGAHSAAGTTRYAAWHVSGAAWPGRGTSRRHTQGHLGGAGAVCGCVGGSPVRAPFPAALRAAGSSRQSPRKSRNCQRRPITKGAARGCWHRCSRAGCRSRRERGHGTQRLRARRPLRRAGSDHRRHRAGSMTSLPNAVAAVHLARGGRGAATLSEALNSNSLNVLAGLFIPAVIIASPGPGISLRIAIWYGVLTLATLSPALAGWLGTHPAKRNLDHHRLPRLRGHCRGQGNVNRHQLFALGAALPALALPCRGRTRVSSRTTRRCPVPQSRTGGHLIVTQPRRALRASRLAMPFDLPR
jgi:hypothetical protein